MTGYTVHTGSNVKFTEGWDRVFGGSKKPSRTQPEKATKPKPKSAESRKKA